MRATVIGAVLIGLVSAAVPAQAQVSPTQAQASCAWVASDLPLPAGVTGGRVVAAGPNGYLAGHARLGGMLVWHNRVLNQLTVPAGTTTMINAVNGRGDVVGYDVPNSKAFLHRDGVYRVLPSPAGQRAEAVAINESGDVVGYLGDGAAPYEAVVWKADQPDTYRVLGWGKAVGIDDAGRVVTESGEIHHPDGTSTHLDGYPSLRIERYEDGHILGRHWDELNYLREWDVTGAQVRRWDPMVSSHTGINAGGLLALWYFKYGNRGNTLGVWRGGTFISDVGPRINVNAVTDADELAGSREVVAGQPWKPATWTCG
ncbi:hypothetical protein [Saccharothrix hoggarensis]|uniref:HAF family extracellular repeat protein n=1 Tax=Saccharothrix hoggarensis TaxID=913853 RepID=A0ABW3QLG2_9PSEU